MDKKTKKLKKDLANRKQWDAFNHILDTEERLCCNTKRHRMKYRAFYLYHIRGKEWKEFMLATAYIEEKMTKGSSQ